jgi:cytochrome b561
MATDIPEHEDRRGLAGHRDAARHRDHYSAVGILFHWTMAALILFQLWWGWRASRLPVGWEKLAAYELHFQLGMAVLLIALARIAYRIAIPRPEVTDDVQGWQRLASEAVFWLFYLLMIGLPVSGWLMMAATGGRQLPDLFGILPWPHLAMFDDMSPARRQVWEAAAESTHFLMIWTMGLLTLGHAGFALLHHFVFKDPVLTRMIPALPEPEPD